MTKNPIILEIPKRSRLCTLGQENLEPGALYYSVLHESKEGLVRSDFCEECWNKSGKEQLLQGAKSHWKSRVASKEAAKIDMSKDQRALEFFKEIYQSAKADEQVIAFVLALYLVRHKIFALRQEMQQEGETIMLFEALTTEEMFGVRKPDVAKIEIDKVQAEITKRL